MRILIASFGIPFPSQLDDTDQPVTITTDYILEPDENALRIETTGEEKQTIVVPVSGTLTAR